MLTGHRATVTRPPACALRVTARATVSVPLHEREWLQQPAGVDSAWWRLISPSLSLLFQLSSCPDGGNRIAADVPPVNPKHLPRKSGASRRQE